MFHYQPFPKQQILDSSKQKELADDNFKFDEQFLLFPQCFQKACFPGASKGVIVWEWVKKENMFHY